MSSHRPVDITYSISKIEYLYSAPPVNLLSHDIAELRGESVYRRLRREYDDVFKDMTILPRLIIKLPADQLEPGLEARVNEGIRRYAINTIRDNDLRLHDLQAGGLRQAVFGLIFLGICLVIAFAFSLVESPALYYNIARILVQGFTVIGWVALWHPTEILLFDRSPYHQENRILSRLQNLEIKIVPQD
jgi:hypothetical protein